MPQRELKDKDKTATGVVREVVVSSPSCTQKNTSSFATRHTSPPQQTNSSLKNNNKHHLAFVVPSPARDRAAARQGTRMILQTKRHNPLTPSHTPPEKPQTSSRKNSNLQITTTQPIQSPPTAPISLLNSSQAAITTPILPSPKQASQRSCPNQQQPRASIEGSSFHRRAARKKTRRQPDIHLPRNKQTAPSKPTTSITWPSPFLPQHETVPPLNSAQE